MKSRKTSWRKEHLGCALKDLLSIWLKNSLKGMTVNKWRVAIFFPQNNFNYVEKYMWYYKQRWVTSWDKNMTKDRPISWTIHKRNGTGQWTSKTVFDLANNQRNAQEHEIPFCREQHTKIKAGDNTCSWQVCKETSVLIYSY